MGDVFLGKGPCFLEKKDPSQAATPSPNPYSWTTATNMIYIDQPSLTGFSYSNPAAGCLDEDGDVVQIRQNMTCPPKTSPGTFSRNQSDLFETSTPQAAISFYKVLQGFMGAFPQYSNNSVVFATESYGGHFGPIYSEYIMKQNELNISNTVKLPISAIIIINGLHNALIQYPAYYRYAISNLYDVQMLNESTSQKMSDALFLPNGCMSQLQLCNSPSATDQTCFTADDTCYNASNLAPTFSKRDEYDIRYLKPSPFPPRHFKAYLNLPHVQAALGVYTNFTSSSNLVFNAFLATGDTVKNLTIMSDMKTLLTRRNIPMTLLYGDADYLCNWIGGEAVAEDLGIPGFEKSGYVDVVTEDKVVHAQVRSVDGFAFVRAYRSGHMVPFYQPGLALDVFKRMVEKKDIATGKGEMRGITGGTGRSEFREGNGTVLWDVVKEEGAVYDLSAV